MIKAIIIYCLHGMKYGSIAMKIKSSFYMALLISPLGFIIDETTKWASSQQVYIAFVLTAIVMDHILGTLVHLFVKRDFSFRRNIVGLLVKVGLVICVEITMNGILHIAGSTMVSSYLAVVGQLLVFLYPAGSAMINCSHITKGRFPPIAFIDRVNMFNKNLDPKELDKKEKK